MYHQKGVNSLNQRAQSVILCALFVTAILLSWAPPFSAAAKANSKYASLVIDANTGKILHARNASAKRYPASLTKLMTLYLTFEALDEGRLDMDTKMVASSRAAGMPQTNISLQKGDTITVRDAITALVVRSANDVAVVIAEHLGRNEQAFARMMTRKAHSIGMKNTTFRNASGLPDRMQRSTAKDLVLLAVALKRHYPQYYHFFSNSQFTFKGRTFKSHNKVMKKLPGADGLKTGYINASGFNLLTSARRGGRNLVAAVLGGRTSKSRDKHMVDLMERAFAGNASVSDRRQFSAVDTPKPKFRPGSEPMQIAVRDARTEEAKPVKVASMHVTPISFKINDEKNSNGQFQPQELQELETSSEGDRRYWGVQVGAFQHSKEALLAAVKATSIAEPELERAKILISNGVKNDGRLLHRARLGNLAEEEARVACQKLKQRDASCFVFRMASGQSL